LTYASGQTNRHTYTLTTILRMFTGGEIMVGKKQKENENS